MCASRFDRRTLLAGGAALALAAPQRAAAAADPRAAAGSIPTRQPAFKLSLAGWSLHRTIFAQRLDHLDFPRAASALGFDAVEYVNRFWKDKAQDRAYLAELKSRARQEGVWSALVMIDGEGALGAADEAKRRQAVENHRKWIDAAAYLGCHSIRVNAQSDGATHEEQAKLAADGLRRLSELGGAAGIDVLVENHGGLSSHGAWLAGVMKAVDHPRCGTLPDFGNFRISPTEEYDRYKGVAELMPFAKAVSAKSHAFDRRGNETRTDYRRMLEIVVRAGYRGLVGVEYEGDALSEVDGILATKRLLERVRTRLAA